jgi:hypothetical protein
MVKQELFHIQEKDTIAILSGQWHKTMRIINKFHGLPYSIVQILMKDSHLLMEKQEQSHTQEMDSIAIQNGLWLKINRTLNQLHGLP